MSARTGRSVVFICLCLALAAAGVVTVVHAQQGKVDSSYGPTNLNVTFEQVRAARMAVKAERAKEHMDLLNARYDLSARRATDVSMSGGKPIPLGPTAKLQGVSFEDLGKMTPEEIKAKGLFPYRPLPFADHAEGGMLFPEMIAKVLPRLIRFDLEFDLPEHVLPDPAPAIYLTTRPDLGDVAKGRLITVNNYYEVFNGILNPKQLEGLRLLLTQFPQRTTRCTTSRPSASTSKS